MNEDSLSVWELLEVFYKSSCYNDVVWQRFSVLHAPTAVKSLVLEILEEFRGKLPVFLEKYTMIASRTYEPIISGNPVIEVRKCLARVFSADMTPKESFDAISSLRGAGIFVSSTLLSLAYEGRFIPLADGVWEGFEELFPSLAAHMKKPSDYESFLEFQHACDAVAEVYGLESMAELHEFLWHGQHTNWSFE